MVCQHCGYPKFGGNQAIGYVGPVCVCDWRGKFAPAHPSSPPLTETQVREIVREELARAKQKGE